MISIQKPTYGWYVNDRNVIFPSTSVHELVYIVIRTGIRLGLKDLFFLM